MASNDAQRLVAFAVSQYPYHERNGYSKYGAEFGNPGGAWCAYFVCYCFKHTFGSNWTSYIANTGLADITVASVKRGVAKYVKTPQPGDVWSMFSCGSPHGHTGIVQSVNVNKRTLTTIEGNSSDQIKMRTFPWSHFTDIVRPNKFFGADFSGSYSSSSSSNGGVSSTTSKPVPYKEYYKTKPKNTTHVAEYHSSDSSVKINLIKSKRQTTLLKDWENVQEIFPDNKIIETNIKNVNNSYDFSLQDLINQYTKMLQIMEEKLVSFSHDIDQNCYAITGDKNMLRYCYLIKYSNRYNNDFEKYYNPISQKWRELFNKLTLKRDALLYFQEIENSFQPVLSAQEYISKRKKEISNLMNKQIVDLYQQIQEVINNNNMSFKSIGQQIQDINQSIHDLTLQINAINKEITTNYPNNIKLNKLKNNYEIKRDNLKELGDNFKYNNFSDEYTYWNKNIIQNPNLLNFWLEFNQENEFYNYSVKNIGIRSIATTNNVVNSIYYRETPQIIYYSNDNINRSKTGYNYIYFKELDKGFTNSAQGISAKDQIDDLLYQHSFCNQEINLSTIPIYYLEPNTRIFVYNESTKTNNEYILNKISSPLSYNGMMSLSATKAVDRLY